MRRSFGIVVCAVAFLAAGCHRNNLNSGYGQTWVTLTSEPSDFSSYTVYLDGIYLTRNDGAIVSPFSPSYYEKVDFTKLANIEEMLGGTSVATGTYTSATFTLDYTNASASSTAAGTITVLVNGVPTGVKVVDTSGNAVTTQTVTVNFDPKNPLVLNPTYATTAASRLMVDFNLAASTQSLDMTTSPPTLTVKPYATMSVSAADQRLIRVRGPLINSSVGEQTFTLYVRPFYDMVDAIGTVTMFNDANTIYMLNGSVYTGQQGASAIAQASTGTTIMAAYTTFQSTPTPSAAAGIFSAKYVIGGSSLQDNYTYGIEGMVIARAGNVLTLRGATVNVNDGSISTSSTFYLTDATVTVGPNTTVLQDNSTSVLNYNAIGVGQHIAARGNYTLTNGVVAIDATANSGTTTGSVRIIPEPVQGTLLSSGAGSSIIAIQSIDNYWPSSVFNFAGNGATTAQDTNPAAFNVASTAAAATAVGNTLIANGTVPGFGVTPPDFTATALSDDSALPASVRVAWNTTGAENPFVSISDAGFTIDTANAAYVSGVVRVGSQSIPLTSIGTLQIVPLPLQSTATTLDSITTPAPVYNPNFCVGNITVGVSCYSVFDTYVAKLYSTLGNTPAMQFEARGVWNRTSNVFTATTVNIVL